eukprot:TRINITY_DN9340_c0_g1_i1.p1 TRINITY_DN9340_c0_g1~~TRINITY_DN9340_c0_g1_i1.p1  ORF type:complete len:446 (-),score=90.39 TRINITY_DN9340_c0_g1_i1:273-1610(-)
MQATSISLGDKYLGDEGAIASVVDLLRTVRTDESVILDLHGNGLTEKCASSFSFLQDYNVTRINFSWNRMGLPAELCSLLSCNTSILSLDLRNLNVDSTGATNLAKTLTQNTTLTDIDLSWNNISSSGAEALLRGLEKNATLLHLALEGNQQIEEKVLRQIATCLERNLVARQSRLSIEETLRQAREEKTSMEASTKKTLTQEVSDSAIIEAQDDRNLPEKEANQDTIAKSCCSQIHITLQIAFEAEKKARIEAEIQSQALVKQLYEAQTLYDSMKKEWQSSKDDLKQQKEQTEKWKTLDAERTKELEMTTLKLKEEIALRKQTEATLSNYRQEQALSLKNLLDHHVEELTVEHEKLKKLLAEKEAIDRQLGIAKREVAQLRVDNQLLAMESKHQKTGLYNQSVAAFETRLHTLSVEHDRACSRLFSPSSSSSQSISSCSSSAST